ncbi:MAG: hypothetical protein JWO03_616 [Bacteroidetes bacterium]|nr:hypothetical protein [Bacteroidota bacterium]
MATTQTLYQGNFYDNKSDFDDFNKTKWQLKNIFVAIMPQRG